ncbi:MAG: asparaginase [Acidobacteria bacterium]|nr:MAG: asparaginase [Acidobacteriota bacterium]
MADPRPTRRDLIGTAALAGVGAALPAGADEPAAPAAAPAAGLRIVTSHNGVEAAKVARQALIEGKDPLDAAIAGVNVVELDPDDYTVGYGGIPNEDGVVELDAAVMDGRTMRAGAVGALRGVKTPSKVARLVMDRTDRVFLVGEGARRFATAHGFPDEDLLTEKTRKIYRYWKDRLSDSDDWVESGKEADDPVIREFIRRHGDEFFRPQGTIHLSIRSAKGELVGVTTTSGLFFKIPGRLGDSPVVGAGLYAEGGVGACGSTGRGEANLVTCGSHTVVEELRKGKSPEEACLVALARIAEKTHLVPRHRDAQGRPRFGVTFYAVDARGRTAGASIWSGQKYVVGDDEGVRTLDAAYLYRKPAT